MHGRYQLPEGYLLVSVPYDAQFEHDEEVELAYSYNLPNIAVSIFQLVYACWTLYSSKGDQLNRWGYTSFGLTVVPYAFMSLVNLLGNAFCPSYDCVYMVNSPCLRSLREQNVGSAFVDGEVGTITQATEDNCLRMLKDPFLSNPNGVSIMTAAIIGSLPLAIIGAISKFERASSTLADRVWSLLWLTLPIIVGPAIYSAFGSDECRPYINPRRSNKLDAWAFFLAGLIYSAPAIGRFVVVGQMIKSYGMCEVIS